MPSVVVFAVVVVMALAVSPSKVSDVEYHDYIVVGAGPAGLQMGFFLDRAGRDYVILERNNIAGSFFTIYPRHEQIISINKRHTGKTNVEFNMRHDWNSLISTYDQRRQPSDSSSGGGGSNGTESFMRFGAYSRRMFPQRSDLVRYLNDFAANASLRIRYNTDVANIGRLAEAENEATTTTTASQRPRFTMNDQNGKVYQCHTLLVGTGMWKPNAPPIEGEEFIEGYETVNINAEDFEGQSVLVLGRGNSAFEFARDIYGSTNLIHMVGRSRMRLSWSTHYVGDLRAVNNELLDTYQLKSLDGIFEAPVEYMAIRRRNGKLYLEVRDDINMPYSKRMDDTNIPYSKRMDDINIPYSKRMDDINIPYSKRMDDINIPYSKRMDDVNQKASMTDATSVAVAENDTNSGIPTSGRFVYHDNFAAREPYDRVVRCLGFTFNDSIFRADMPLSRPKGLKSKYPKIDYGYESVDYPGLYFIGTATHSLDLRKSAGGFIHGFRYTARALHRMLEWLHHGLPWPSRSGSAVDLLTTIVKRINEASGIYQMYRMLGDVILLRGDTFEYIDEFPLNLLHELPQRSGVLLEADESNGRSAVDGILVVSLEYGAKFSGPGEDVFRMDRATGDPAQAHRSNFLHPVFYYYKKLPTAADMRSRRPTDVLPRPYRMHHTVEDFLTTWDAPISHVLPLRRFVESTIYNGAGSDLRSYFADSCFVAALTHRSLPLSCSEHYLAGYGIERPPSLPFAISDMPSNASSPVADATFRGAASTAPSMTASSS